MVAMSMMAFFARYNLNNSAARGWLSWILISFLDFVDLVVCHDGVIMYRHGQTVCKNFTDYIQDWLGLTMVIDSVLAPWHTHLFLHTLKKHSVNWELNVKAIMTVVFSLPQKAVLIILFTSEVQYPLVKRGIKKGILVSLVTLFWHDSLNCLFPLVWLFSCLLSELEGRDSLLSTLLVLSALLVSDRYVLSEITLDTWSAGWAVFVPLK